MIFSTPCHCFVIFPFFFFFFSSASHLLVLWVLNLDSGWGEEGRSPQPFLIEMKFLTPRQLPAGLMASVMAVLLVELHLSNVTKGAFGSRSISCMRQWAWLNCSRKDSGEVRGRTS